ncbi:MAG: hypothetical protein ABI543_08765 [Ignavibacteria bacterium]
MAQAEFPRVLKTYIKINDNAKLIKDSKIKNSTEILSINGKDDTIRISNYDTDGYIVYEISKTDTSKDKKGEYIIRSTSYIYNNFKLLTEKFDSSAANLKKYYLKYDEFYNITDEELYIQNKLIQKYTYEYDDLSRLIESTLKDAVNDCKITETYDYNSYNNMVKLIVKNKCIPGEGKAVETKFNYTYDASYRILGKSTFSPLGENKTETFTYTSEGKPETSYEMIRTDYYINRKYTYDKNTVRIQKIEVKEELSTSSDVLIKYDKFGNRLEEEYYDPAGKLIYTYKFIYTYY